MFSIYRCCCHSRYYKQSTWEQEDSFTNKRKWWYKKLVKIVSTIRNLILENLKIIFEVKARKEISATCSDLDANNIASLYFSLTYFPLYNLVRLIFQLSLSLTSYRAGSCLSHCCKSLIQWTPMPCSHYPTQRKYAHTCLLICMSTNRAHPQSHTCDAPIMYHTTYMATTNPH